MPLFDGITKKIQDAKASVRPKFMDVSEADIKTRLAQGEELVSSVAQAVVGYPKTLVLTTQRIMVFQNTLTQATFTDYYFRDMADVKFSTNFGGGMIVLKADRGNNVRTETIEKLPLEESKAFYQRLVGIERDWFEKKRNLKLEEDRAVSGGAQVVVTGSGAAAAAAPALDVEGKLMTLKNLFDKGVINEQEYSSKRQALLNQL